MPSRYATSEEVGPNAIAKFSFGSHFKTFQPTCQNFARSRLGVGQITCSKDGLTMEILVVGPVTGSQHIDFYSAY